MAQDTPKRSREKPRTAPRHAQDSPGGANDRTSAALGNPVKPQENPRKSSRSPGETVSSRKDQKAVSQHSSSQQQYCAAGVAKRVDPAALPLGSMRSCTQIAFSRQRRLALAEIHGVESPKRGAEFHFPQICTTPIRNACFLHKWPSGLTGGGGIAPGCAGVSAISMGV